MTNFPVSPAYINELNAYQEGKSITSVMQEFNLQESEILKLASNENPLGMPESVIQGLHHYLDDFQNNNSGRYPNAAGNHVKHALLNTVLKQTHTIGFNHENIILGNGSEELLMLATRAFAKQGDTVVYSQYSFIIYKLASQSIGATAIEVPSHSDDFSHDLDAMARTVKLHDAKIVYLTNPNNPTGTYHSAEKITDFLKKIPQTTLIVLDEAYIEYVANVIEKDVSMHQIQITKWLEEHHNLLILRTFSKAYGLAALRLGYGVASSYVIKQLSRLRQAFNSNAMAQHGAIIALHDDEFLQKTITLNALEKQKWYTFFKRPEIAIDFILSHTNFILIKLNIHLLNQYGTGKNYCDKLLESGLIIRPMSMYNLNDYVRISIGNTIENQKAQAIIERTLRDF